ncbi:cytochrome c-type biogenesis protein [Actibacterium pelagium]|uniref:Cytochrome c-type biogenesis protein n=1 Tax=Actibacterium pelagium TaxID=2029103 RepID=A0A917EI12_9RHOB|nr:cytochrome c-type biogenesis protein [Actibacterium pelagium]GGE44936.1 cytochrome c biogenesis protein CcdA [Actibacterium pelagium]
MKRLILILSLLVTPVLAVEPDEILADPKLEERARELSKGLRCLVCRNESIDESNADLAKDLRLLVRERLVAGDTNDQVIDFVVDRYGEYVLLKPTTGGANLVLWATGPIVLLLAIGAGAMFVRSRRRSAQTSDDLTDEEQARLKEIMGE